MRSRREMAAEHGVDEGVLRNWERIEILPAHGSVGEELYEDRLRVILASRRAGLSVQRYRRVMEEERSMVMVHVQLDGRES